MSRALHAAGNNLNDSTLIGGMFTISNVLQAYYAQPNLPAGKAVGRGPKRRRAMARQLQLLEVRSAFHPPPSTGTP